MLSPRSAATPPGRLADLGHVLDELRRRVPHLQVALDPAGAAERREGGWRCEELLSDPAALASALAACGRGAGTENPALIASVFVLAYAYVVLAPAIGCLALAGLLPGCSPADLEVLAPAGRPSSVAFRRVTLRHAGQPLALAQQEEADTALRTLIAEAVEGHLLPLAEAVRRQARVGARLLAGNIVSSAATLFQTMEGSTGPGVVPAGERFVELLPRQLSGQGRFLLVEREGRHAWLFERSSCCLLERLPHGVRCADCSLTPRAERLARHRGATGG